MEDGLGEIMRSNWDGDDPRTGGRASEVKLNLRAAVFGFLNAGVLALIFKYSTNWIDANQCSGGPHPRGSRRRELALFIFSEISVNRSLGNETIAPFVGEVE